MCHLTLTKIPATHSLGHVTHVLNTAEFRFIQGYTRGICSEQNDSGTHYVSIFLTYHVTVAPYLKVRETYINLLKMKLV